jgi:NodT family efflux transporter outer membrane factor (OMF) lipoprotein
MLGLPEGVTTDLVGRRPDIAAARERAQAEASRVKAARADFFPALRLDALFGFQSLGLDALFQKASSYGRVGPALSLPIFHGGELQGRYAGARAAYDEAVANYDRTVLAAYQQVADAVTSQRATSRRLADARAALAASQDAYDIARQRYEGGLSNYLDVLLVQDRLLQARLALAALNADLRSIDIALIRALGGGFAPGITPSAANSEDRPHG